MSAVYSACKTIHVSPSPPPRDHTCDPVGLFWSQGGCLSREQGQIAGTESGVMEMTEVEYKHPQHLIQAQLEDGPDVRAPPAAVMVKEATGSTMMSPFTTTQAIDLSTSGDEHCLAMAGEKTPAPYGEVPGFVLVRIRCESTLNESPSNNRMSTEKRMGSAARVCLEKRFNTVAAATPKQSDIQSAVLSNFLTILHQSAEGNEVGIHPQLQKWMKNERGNLFESSSPCLGGVFNSVTNMCGQVIGHIPRVIESNKRQVLIIPRGFSLNICPDSVVTKLHNTSSSNPTEEKKLVNVESHNGEVTTTASRDPGCVCRTQPAKAGKTASDSAEGSQNNTRKRARSSMPHSQRRERHNTKERERRKRIRLCCDELNMLVPFCDSNTDKVTTLQWTTAFLRFINKTYGDAFKEEFLAACTSGKGLFLKFSPSSGQDAIHRGMDEVLSSPLSVEQ